MGQIKKILANFELKDNAIKKIDIELNVGPDGGADHIHIQTEQWRMEFKEHSFIHLANAINAAASKLKKIKGL